MKRALLGIDGNCGFALLGDDIQSGEAEFVEIIPVDPYGDELPSAAACRAATKAYRRLMDRLPDEVFSYRLDPSHPRYA